MLKYFFCWGIQGIKRCCDFKGRSCRREVWSYFFLSFGFVGIISLLTLWMSDALYVLLMLSISVIFMIPAISSWVRRLHDLNLSGKWLFLLFGIICSCNGYLFYYFVLPLPMTLNMTLEEIEVMKQEADPMWVVLSILCLYFVMWIVFLVLMVMRGSDKINKYGLSHNYLDCDRV